LIDLIPTLQVKVDQLTEESRKIFEEITAGAAFDSHAA
jgi:hypothetical protein